MLCNIILYCFEPYMMCICYVSALGWFDAKQNCIALYVLHVKVLTVFSPAQIDLFVVFQRPVDVSVWDLS